MEINIEWWHPTAFGLVGLGLGYVAHSLVSRAQFNSARHKSQMMLESARRESEVMLRDAKINAQEESIRVRKEFEDDTKTKRLEGKTIEKRINEKEHNLDRKVDMLDKKEHSIDKKLELIEQQREEIQQQRLKLEQSILEERQNLERIANLSHEEARETLMKEMEEELKSESGALIRRKLEEAKNNAEKEARKIITMAIERYSADQVNEATTSSVALPNEEMKGRIIGKEGRNIRALESMTGVNILIDDTPETVVISGFDPLRREVARIALEQLINDGRIHPARIEEVVNKVREELDQTIKTAGEEAIFELDIQGVAPEIVRTLGRLKFRKSYSQNVLKHSIEMGHIMGMMASELGLDTAVAKRAGLFHDIGKALDHEIEGSHAIIGADVLKRQGEDPVVVNAVASHHKDVEPESLYAVLVSAADAITAARPGARSENTQLYIKRLEKLEEIATSFRGVEKCYAMQAGREIRVIVEPSKIDDNEAMQMARNIAKQIEEQLEYPGQIKVNVVRETRCIEYAR